MRYCTTPTRRISASRWPIVTLALAFALALSLCFVAQAHADNHAGSLTMGSANLESQQQASIITDTLWAGEDPRVCQIFVDDDSDGILKARSSNKGVLEIVKLADSEGDECFCMKPLKAGTSRVTVTYKAKNKTKVASGIVTVKQYPKAIKALAINGKKAPVPTTSNPIHNSGMYNVSAKKIKVRATIAKGWNLDGMTAFIWREGAMEADKSISLENGESFTLPAKTSATIDITISKGNDEFYYTLDVSHGEPLVLKASNCYIGLDGIVPDYLYTADVNILKVKSSNPKVLKATKGAAFNDIRLTGMKSGKSTLSITYKYQGKKYTTKASYRVIGSPFDKFTINGKAVQLVKGFSATGNHYYYRNADWNKSSSKLVLKPSQGWTVKSIMFDNGKKPVETKSGATKKTPKGKDSYYQITLENKSGKQFTITVMLLRS